MSKNIIFLKSQIGQGYNPDANHPGANHQDANHLEEDHPQLNLQDLDQGHAQLNLQGHAQLNLQDPDHGHGQFNEHGYPIYDGIIPGFTPPPQGMPQEWIDNYYRVNMLEYHLARAGLPNNQIRFLIGDPNLAGAATPGAQPYALQNHNIPVTEHQIKVFDENNVNSEIVNTSLDRFKCTICLTNEISCLLLPCSHAKFCITCIGNWSKTHNTCPICGQAFTSFHHINLGEQDISTRNKYLKYKTKYLKYKSLYF